MFRNLCCGAIGVPADLDQSIAYAKLGGFGGIDVPIGEILPILEQQGAGAVKALFADNGLQMGGIGVPVDWQGSEEAW